MEQEFEFKGTQGKWVKSNEPFFDESEGIRTYSGGFDIHSEDGVTKVVEVHAYNFWGLTFTEAKANALLISKAPEMLEMLKKCKDALLELQEYQDGWEQDYEDLKQLLKEATTL